MIKANFFKCSPQLSYTLLYGFSIVFMKGLSLILLPFLTHNLTQNDYGQLEIITTIAAFGSILAGLGLAETLFRFCGMALNETDRIKHASRLLKLSLLLGILLAVVGVFVADDLARIIQYGLTENMVRLTLVMIAFEAMNAVPLGWLRMQNRVGHFCFLLCARALIQLIFTVLFIKYGLGVMGILLAGSIAALTQIILLMYFVRKELFLANIKLNISLYLRYSAPIMYSGLVAFCLFGADKWVLSLFATLSEVALLGVASKIALTCVILLQPFTMWWSPKRFEIYNQGGTKTLTYYTTLGIAFVFIAGSIISMISPLIFEYLLPATYASAAILVPPLILAMLCKELTELINIGCFVSKKSHTQAIINTITALITLFILYISTRVYGIYGLVWGLCIGQLIRLIVFYIASNKIVTLAFDFKKLSILMVVSVTQIVLIPVLFSNIHQVFLSLIIVLMLSFLTYHLTRLNATQRKTAYA